MKRILFRADAFPSIGIGDLMSLIHLARYFTEQGWQCHFLIKDYEAGCKLVQQYQIPNIHIISQHFTLADEEKEINRLIERLSIDLLFFEITARKLTDYTGITSNVKKACICFDGAIPHGLDLVVDWDADAAKFFSPELFPETRFLLGPKYVILSNTFDTDLIAKRFHNKNPKKLLVCMGGADELNFTQKVTDLLLKNNIPLHTTIIVGSGYRELDALQNSLNKGKISYEIKHNISTMFEEYMNCDIAIGAGGLTSSELVYTRTPAILIATYEHQIARCQYFARQGLATYLGYREIPEEQLISSVLNPSLPQGSFTFTPEAIVESCNEIIQ